MVNTIKGSVESNHVKGSLSVDLVDNSDLNCIPEYGGLGHIKGSEIEIKFLPPVP
jgi:hypothetical protein